MKPIPFIGSSYESRSVAADDQVTINLYIEQDTAGGEKQLLVGTPGTVLQYALTGTIRGCDVMGTRTFFVAGSTFYETTGGTPKALGSLVTSVGRVSMAHSDTQLLVVDGTAGYVFDGTTFTQIADVDFPNGVTRATWESEFFIVGVDGSKQFFISALNDATSWDGLDFASVENKPETMVSLTVYHDRLLLFTQTGMEQWANTGAEEFPYERDNGSSVDVGCSARDSVTIINDAVYWLGRDVNGGGIVFKLTASGPQRISTFPMERLLQSVDHSDAYALGYQQEGHYFYCLTIPALERTFVYDAATEQWCDRAYWNANSGAFSRWRPFCHVFDGRRNLVGDYANGNVYALDPNEPTDNGSVIRWLRRTPPMTSNMARVYFGAFQLDAEVGRAANGVNPQIMLRWSDDGGLTWSDPVLQTLGATGETRQRIIFRRCGYSRRRVWELSGTAAVKPVLYGAYVEALAEAA